MMRHAHHNPSCTSQSEMAFATFFPNNWTGNASNLNRVEYKSGQGNSNVITDSIFQNFSGNGNQFTRCVLNNVQGNGNNFKSCTLHSVGGNGNKMDSDCQMGFNQQQCAINSNTNQNVFSSFFGSQNVLDNGNSSPQDVFSRFFGPSTNSLLSSNNSIQSSINNANSIRNNFNNGNYVQSIVNDANNIRKNVNDLRNNILSEQPIVRAAATLLGRRPVISPRATPSAPPAAVAGPTITWPAEFTETSTEIEANQCVICMDHEQSAVIVNCGHGNFCVACLKSQSSKICPNCREPIKQVVRVFRG